MMGWVAGAYAKRLILKLRTERSGQASGELREQRLEQKDQYV